MSVTRQLPAQLDSFFTATGALAMRDVCCKSGNYNGAQAVRVFHKAREISFDTLITADDVSRAWREVGVREYQVPRGVDFYGIRN